MPIIGNNYVLKRSFDYQYKKEIRLCYVHLEKLQNHDNDKSAKKSTMTTEAVYKILQVHNRPFSANDLVSQLDKEKHGKSAIQKSLDKLTESGKIFAKTYGKQKIYCFCQDTSQAQDDVARIENELQMHTAEQQKRVVELNKELQQREQLLTSLKSGMSYQEAVQEEARLKENLNHLTMKLDQVMENTGSEDLGARKKKAEKDLNLYSKEYLKRKRICSEILDCILETYPGSKKDLYNEIGIESVG